MSLIVRTKNLIQHSAFSQNLGKMHCVLLSLLVASLHGFAVEVNGGNPIGYSLSFGGFRAPAHQRHRSFSGNSAYQDQGSKEGSEMMLAPEVSGNEVQDVFYSNDRDVNEANPGWQGYLREKGPSQIVVEVEIEQELTPLSDEVWGLIMGTDKNWMVDDRSRSIGRDVVQVERNTTTIPKTQLDMNNHVVDTTPEEAVQLHREDNEEESPILDDAAESYQQLMELFSRPVFATPATEFGDAESMLSFRIPQGQSASTIRDGSQARFEIRR